MKISHKTVKTIKPYEVKNYRGQGKYGHSFIVPAGSSVSNQTACGNDDDYRYWTDFHKVAEEVTGHKTNTLSHDLTYYGLNIPAEYCEPYPEDKEFSGFNKAIVPYYKKKYSGKQND